MGNGFRIVFGILKISQPIRMPWSKTNHSQNPTTKRNFSVLTAPQVWILKALGSRITRSSYYASQSISYIILITFTRNPTTKRISKNKLEITRTPPPSGKYKQQLRTQATPDGPQSSSGSIWRRRQPTEKISSDAGKGSLPLRSLSLFFVLGKRSLPFWLSHIFLSQLNLKF